MSQKLILLVLTLAVGLTSSVFSATIVWVSDNKDPTDGVPADQAWIDMLVANGYTVNLDFRDGEAAILSEAEIAALEAADLIIVSRNINSGWYNGGDEPTIWNSLQTPLILQPMHIARSSHWRWFNSTNIQNGLTELEAVDLLHPLFDGVPLGTNNQVSIIRDQPSTIGWLTDVGNGNLIGRRGDNDGAWIVEWQAGQEFFPGAGQFAGARRMYLPSGGTDPDGTYNLTAEGETLFLNAIEYMLGSGERLKAYNPTPGDATTHVGTWVKLSWLPGVYAVSHNVYLGENFDDVSNGTGGTFQRNQIEEFIFAGRPGYPYPDGLVPGTTYYWRIDEVNDADPNSPWEGDVWSFKVPSTSAYDPTPADGARFIDPDVTLTWTPGYDSVLDYLYFGTDEDAVRNATTGSPEDRGIMGTNSFAPGTLDREMTYYWRVDSDDFTTVHTGDVWSFTIAREGGGVRGEYYDTADFGSHQLTRVDPQINFNWGTESPDESIDVDTFSVRWTGEVEAAFSETYTFYTLASDGVRLWVDGQLIIDHWTEHGTIEDKGIIDLVAGNVYGFMLEYYEESGNAVAQLFWSSAHTPKQIIPQAALSLPRRASNPSPANRATGTRTNPILSWDAGDEAASHEVYFGADKSAVQNATTGSPEHKVTRPLGSETYSPGALEWAKTYYWRIDEVNSLNPDSPWVGSVWSFTTADFLTIDDFELYDTNDNQIWFNWRDGLGSVVLSANRTGSEVGDLSNTNSYTEETIVHGGAQSMPYWYNNNKPDDLSGQFFKYSEAQFTLTDARDWTEQGVEALSLWFMGRLGPGSFTEDPVGTYTISARGADIFGEADEFHFVYLTLNGYGSITARVQSILNTDNFAKAGVMIRDTLEPGSKYAGVYITPGYGCRFQARLDAPPSDATSDSGVATDEQLAITEPYWVRLERTGNSFYGYYSSDGSDWTEMVWSPQSILMPSNVYVGLALTAHNPNAECEAVFTNVSTTGSVSSVWMDQDIGIISNDAEPMYVAVANSTGSPAVVYHDDPAAVQIDTWTEWNIDLKEFEDQGIVLSNVDTIAIGFGDRDNPQAGGSGKMYFDDIRLYRPRCMPDEVTLSEADLNGDCVVDSKDLEIMAGDWLEGGVGIASDLNADSAVDLKDYAILADQWLEEQLWPQP